MPDYTGDHRQCDCDGAKLCGMTQDISYSPNCMICKKDLTNAPKGFMRESETT